MSLSHFAKGAASRRRTGVVASGGNVTTVGGYTIHRFTATGNSTFTVTNGGLVDVLIVGGGGGGGNFGGGGGAGGVRYLPAMTVAAQSYTITVGSGGAGRGSGTDVGGTGTAGGSSSALGYTATGGGGGGSRTSSPFNGTSGTAGGSGGGGSPSNTSVQGVGGNGTSGQGYRGGNGPVSYSGGHGGGGGGGACNAGTAAPNINGGAGGIGALNRITGSFVGYGSGGGGCAYSGDASSSAGLAGANGGGGNGSRTGAGGNGTANTGGGGGGGAYTFAGGTGGSGVVIIRYRTAGPQMWTPANLASGWIAWWDADDLSTMSFSGSNVTQWRDKGATGPWHMAPSGVTGPTVNSTVIAGRSVLEFTTTQGIRTTADFSTKPTSVFVVERMTGGANQRILQGVNNNWLLGYWSGGEDRMFANGAWVHNPTTTTTTNWRMYEVLLTNTSAPFYRDGNLLATGGTTSIVGPNGLTVNNSITAASTDNSACQVAEIILSYAAELSTTERQQIEGYLAHKWGLTASLPAGHPYKTSAPVSA